MVDSIEILAPGKLNLALAVGPTEAGEGDPVDGRHPICSWLVGIDLYDELELQRLPEDRFSRYAILWHEEALRKSEVDWPIQTDLAVRAHLLLETVTGKRMPLQLKLEKRIPVGAGLGGGSSNAAAMLRGCNELFALGLSMNRLKELGAELGSDVPYFLEAGSCLACGFGDEISAFAKPRGQDFVLIFPEFGCSTAQVYGAFDELARDAEITRTELAARFDDAAKRLMGETTDRENGVIEDGFGLFNDLLLAAFRVEPRLRQIRDEVSDLIEMPVQLTGSGSTLYAIVGSRVEAEFIAQAISGRIDGVVAVAAGFHEPARF